MKDLNKDNWNISDIEALTEEEAQMLATESMTVKEHNIYFIAFSGAFGYSVCVFKNNHHIYHANDYELHHRYGSKTHEELRAMYIQALNNKLFTDTELKAPIKDYEEYHAKCHYLFNYHSMQADRVSAFQIFHNEFIFFVINLRTTMLFLIDISLFLENNINPQK